MIRTGMRIGIDGRELSGPRTGVGRYVANLCREWAADAAGREVLVYAPDEAGLTGLGGSGRGARVEVRTVPGAPGVWWEQTALARAADADRLDVFFGPAYSIPLRLAAPAVVALHDISFAVHPEWFGWREGIRRRWLARRAASRAARVVTVSEFARAEIVREFDLDPARVVRVYDGIETPALPLHDGRAAVLADDPRTAAADAQAPAGAEAQAPTGAEAPATASAEGPALVLFVGSIFNRRHLPTLIAAFARVVRGRPDARLAIIGADRTHPAQDLPACAEAAGVADRVDLCGHLPDAELGALFRRARVFAFLSEYEGFGMTPLEALAAGVPAVVGDSEVAREVCGDAARYVPVDDAAAVAREIERLLDDEALRARLLALGAARLERFTWRRAAAEMLEVLEQAAAGGA